MISLLIFIACIGIFSNELRKDYRRDRGKHRQAKLLHAACVLGLLAWYVGTPMDLYGQLANYFDLYTFEQTAMDFTGFHIVLYAIRTISGIYLMFNWLSRIVQRQDRIRKRLMMFLPFLGLIESYFAFYGALHTFQLPTWIALSISLIVCMGIFLGIRKIYRLEIMARFFELDNDPSELSKEQLEELVEEIGQQRPE
ncbi:MAG: hypothetical protein AAF206_16130 [Bacteroidota bacterium]